MRPKLTAMAVILTNTAALILTSGTALAATPTSATGQPSAIFASSVTTKQCEDGGGSVEINYTVGSATYGTPYCGGGSYNGQQILNRGGGY